MRLKGRSDMRVFRVDWREEHGEHLMEGLDLALDYWAARRLRGLGYGGRTGQALAPWTGLIRETLAGASRCLLLAGLAGRLGVSAVAVLAGLARESGVPTLALLAHSYRFEGRKRDQVARDALARLAGLADATVVIVPDELPACLPRNMVPLDGAIDALTNIVLQ